MTAWALVFFRDDRGEWPALRGRSPASQARILRKLEHLAAVARHEDPTTIGRPLVDSLDPPDLKRLQVDRQLRVVFSWEFEADVILALESLRKKGGRVSPAVVRRAHRSREVWRRKRSGDSIDVVRQTIGG